MQGSRLVLQDFLELRGLIGPIHQPQRPPLGELPREMLGIAAGMSLIHQTEVGFQSNQHVLIGAEKRFLLLEDCFQRSPPPRQLEFGGDRTALDVSSSEVLDQRPEVHLLEVILNFSAVLQALQNFGLLAELLEQHQHLQGGHVGEALPLAGATQNTIELVQILLNLSDQHVEVGQTRGNTGLVTRVHVAVPEFSLRLNLHQRLVQVGNGDTRSHVLFGETFEALALETRHVFR